MPSPDCSVRPARPNSDLPGRVYCSRSAYQRIAGATQMADEYDFFVSYARADNVGGWVERFVDALLDEHRIFTGGRTLCPFFDRTDIHNFAHWETEIFNKGLTRSRLFLAFLSPAYFASEVCRREWKAWIDQEIARHILTAGAAPIYFVEVPGFVSKPMLSEQQVARKVAELCGLAEPLERYFADVTPVLEECRRRQVVACVREQAVQPFYHAGQMALQKEDVRAIFARLAADLDQRSEDARRAAASETTVPPYNRNFTGRMAELLELRRMLKDDRTGVVCGVAGLGGMGKTELAFTYAHAFASVYPGGRFYVPCEGRGSLREAVLVLGDLFRDRIGDEERMQSDSYFAAIVRCLRQRLEEPGHILLVLDNVTDAALVSPEQTDQLTALGPKLHLLATTRLLSSGAAGWLTLGELAPDDALALLEKHRPFADEAERTAAQDIVRRLGGFALAIELVAAGLAGHPTARYGDVVSDLGLDDLDLLAEDRDVELRRHNHEKRLAAVLGPTLAGLSAAERRVLAYSAFLAPDHVPLPWLRELAVADFPELAEHGKWGDPWAELCRKLQRLALFTPAEGEGHTPRLVRVHRLVQDLVQRDLSAGELAAFSEAVEQLVEARDAALENTVRWEEARWELEPMEALARRWDETQHPWTAWLLDQAGGRWHGLAEWTRAEPLMRRALAIDEQSYGPEHPKVAIRLNSLSQLLQATNRLAEAEPLYCRALAILEQSLGDDHPNVASALNNLAGLLRTANRLVEAEPLCRRALAIHEAAFGPDHPNVAICLNSLALLLKDTNRLAEAETLYRRALAILEQSLGNVHPNVATAVNNLAQLLQDTNRLREAEPLYRRALAIWEQSFGDDHPNVASALNNLALLLKDTNRLLEAEPLMRRALAILEQSLGADHPQVASALNNLAQLLQDTNRLLEAETLYRRALAIDEQSYGSDHPYFATALNNLALLLKDTNRLAEAEPLMRRALAILEQSLGADHPNVAFTLNSLAALLYDMNRLLEGEPLYRRALAIDEQSYGSEHPSVARDLNNLALLLQATNRLAEAEPLMRRHVEIFLLFTCRTGHEHPRLRAALGNYAGLLKALGHSDADVQGVVNELLGQYGLSFS